MALMFLKGERISLCVYELRDVIMSFVQLGS